MKQDKAERAERDKERVANTIQASVAAALLGPPLGKAKPAADLGSPLCRLRPEPSGADEQPSPMINTATSPAK